MRVKVRFRGGRTGGWKPLPWVNLGAACGAGRSCRPRRPRRGGERSCTSHRYVWCWRELSPLEPHL